MGACGDLGGSMAHFQRLIWFAVGVLLAVVPMLAAAQSVTSVEDYGGGAFWAAANQHLVGLPDPGATMTLPIVMPQQAPSGAPFLGNGPNCFRSSDAGGFRWECSAAWGKGGSTVMGSIAIRTSRSVPPLPCETGERLPDGTCFTCPPNRVWNGTTCVAPECPPGEVWDDAQRACRMDCELAASQPPSRSHVSQGGALCLMGCKRTRGAVPGGSNCVMQIDVSDGAGGLVCDYAWTGEQCDWTGEKGSGDDPAPEDPVAEEEGQPEQCGAGYVSGTVNGQHTCLLGGPPVDTTDKKTETKTNSDGTTETKESTTETKVNPDGTVTTTTTTTTIVKDAAGNVVGTDVESVGSTQGKDGYCEQNPDDSVCGGGGAGLLTGGCVPGGGVQELACEGDAIQCAIREQTMRTYCQLTASEEVVAEYEAIKEFDGTGEGEGLDRKEIEVPSSLSVTEIGGGAGLQDQSFTIMGETIVIPFSELNRFIEMLGYAIMVIAWLGAWRIIAGAF